MLWARILEAIKNDQGEEGKALSLERVLRISVEFVSRTRDVVLETYESMAKLRLFERFEVMAETTLQILYGDEEVRHSFAICFRCMIAGYTSYFFGRVPGSAP